MLLFRICILKVAVSELVNMVWFAVLVDDI